MKKSHHNVHAVYDGIFNTASGLEIDINNPDPATINLEDIATALSKICRFGGQISAFYSVGLHCLYVAEIAPEYLRLEALMHDASEAYLGDVIKPLKVILGETYGNIERRFMDVIINKFGLNPAYLAEVKQYDSTMLEVEHEYFQQENYGAFKNNGLRNPTGHHDYIREYFITQVQKELENRKQ